MLAYYERGPPHVAIHCGILDEKILSVVVGVGPGRKDFQSLVIALESAYYGMNKRAHREYAGSEAALYLCNETRRMERATTIARLRDLTHEMRVHFVPRLYGRSEGFDSILDSTVAVFLGEWPFQPKEMVCLGLYNLAKEDPGL